MEIKASTVRCPNCGASIDMESNICSYCNQFVYVRTLSNVYDISGDLLNKYINSTNDNVNSLMTKGICYLKLKMYDKAKEHFDRCIDLNMNDSELYFLSAISLLNGNKPFLSEHDTIDKLVVLLNNAITLESKGIYYYFMAYIKKDYFERKYLISEPDYNYYLDKAKLAGVSNKDKEILFTTLNLEYVDL